MSKFQEALTSGKFVVTAEMNTPRGADAESFRKSVDILKDKVDALIVPDNKSACIEIGSVPAGIMVKQQGGEPICTLTCRDRNRLALSSDLLGASVFGIDNILLVSGDYFTFGDVTQAKPVFDLDSVQAIRMVRLMEQGKDAGGNELPSPPSFFIGGVANPQANPLEPQYNKFLKKVRAGADFVLTLDIYDVKRLETFMAQARKETVKVIAGVRILGKKDAENQRNRKLPGNRIPAEWMEKLLSMDEKQALDFGRERCAETIRAIKDKGLAAGVHIGTGHDAQVVADVIAAAGI